MTQPLQMIYFKNPDVLHFFSEPIFYITPIANVLFNTFSFLKMVAAFDNYKDRHLLVHHLNFPEKNLYDLNTFAGWSVRFVEMDLTAAGLVLPKNNRTRAHKVL